MCDKCNLPSVVLSLVLCSKRPQQPSTCEPCHYLRTWFLMIRSRTMEIHKETQDILSEWYAWKTESAVALVSVHLSFYSFLTLDTEAWGRMHLSLANADFLMKIDYVALLQQQFSVLTCCICSILYFPFTGKSAEHGPINGVVRWTAAPMSGMWVLTRTCCKRDIFSNKSSWQSEFWS